MSDRLQSGRATDGAAGAASAGGPEGGSSSPRALLQIWLSPAFPIGAFAYSHGLELAAERGWLGSRAALEAWLADLMTLGALGNDLVLMAHAWRAARAAHWDELEGLAALSVALQPTAERHLEATQQGRSFLDAAAASWPSDAVAELDRRLGPVGVGYAVAVGTAAAGHAVPLDDALAAYALAFLSNLVSAAIRLSIIGQVGGQQVIAALALTAETAARRAATATLDDLASAVMLADLASIAHETQYTRLFRS